MAFGYLSVLAELSDGPNEESADEQEAHGSGFRHGAFYFVVQEDDVIGRIVLKEIRVSKTEEPLWVKVPTPEEVPSPPTNELFATVRVPPDKV